jgi:hypothetical protein
MTLQGDVIDADGLNAVTIQLVQGSSEVTLWEVSWSAVGSDVLTFDETLTLPSEALGECHVEMRATDALGNEVETGFHVEIE